MKKWKLIKAILKGTPVMYKVKLRSDTHISIITDKIVAFGCTIEDRCVCKGVRKKAGKLIEVK